MANKNVNETVNNEMMKEENTMATAAEKQQNAPVAEQAAQQPVAAPVADQPQVPAEVPAEEKKGGKVKGFIKKAAAAVGVAGVAILAIVASNKMGEAKGYRNGINDGLSHNDPSTTGGSDDDSSYNDIGDASYTEVDTE